MEDVFSARVFFLFLCFLCMDCVFFCFVFFRGHLLRPLLRELSAPDGSAPGRGPRLGQLPGDAETPGFGWAAGRFKLRETN